MKYLFPIMLLLVYAMQAQAQNHVPNCGFEDYTQCPAGSSDFTGYVDTWQAHTQGTSDYLNQCSATVAGVPDNFMGYQVAASGKAYIGLLTYWKTESDYKEYASVPIMPLQPGVEYEVSMSVSLADKSGVAADDLGVYFSNNGAFVGISSVLPVKPQVNYSAHGPVTDTQGWVRLKGYFVADAAYSHIVIGGFKKYGDMNLLILDSNLITSYYYIDSVVVMPPPLSGTVADTILCAGDTLSVTPHGPNGTGNVFKLQLSDSMGNFGNPLDLGEAAVATGGIMRVPIPTGLRGKYSVRIISTIPADTSVIEQRVVIRPSPQLSAHADSAIYGGELHLKAGAADSAGYSWRGPQGFTSTGQDPVIYNITLAHSGEYTVTADIGGCSDSDVVQVKVRCNMAGVPAAFSPNGDGHNDVLYVRGSEIKEMYLALYNRWGQVVFETSDMNTGWDGSYKGQPLEVDAVAYILTATFADGETFSGRGSVMVVR